MKYKMIVSDYDRTLADDFCPISEANIKAIHEYIDAGGRFHIATGRMLASSIGKAIALGLKGEIITYQGAATYDIETRKLLSELYIENELAIQLVKFAEYLGCFVQAYDRNGNNYYVAKDNEHTRFYANYCGVPPTIVNMPLSQYLSMSKINVIKIVLMEHEDLISDRIKAFKNNFKGIVNIERSHPKFMEIININASKGNAVKALHEKYGILREEVMCFGDAINDNSMIEYAGFGVAVGNAMEETKSVSDYVCEKCTEDGVAKTINNFAYN